MNQNSLSLHTAKCIVTGKPATIWSGYVRVRGYGPVQNDGRMPILQLAVVAGFSDDATYRSATSDELGCFGNWKSSHGLLLDITYPHNILEMMAVGDYIGISTSLMSAIMKSKRWPPEEFNAT